MVGRALWGASMSSITLGVGPAGDNPPFEQFLPPAGPHFYPSTFMLLCGLNALVGASSSAPLRRRELATDQALVPLVLYNREPEPAEYVFAYTFYCERGP
jgi:hypothetical protein